MGTVRINQVTGPINLDLDVGDPDPIITRGGVPVVPATSSDQSALVQALSTENNALRLAIGELRTNAVKRQTTDDATRDGDADIKIIDALPPPTVVPTK